MELNGAMCEASLWVRLALADLAAWWITHLLASEDGLTDLIARDGSISSQELIPSIASMRAMRRRSCAPVSFVGPPEQGRNSS